MYNRRHPYTPHTHPHAHPRKHSLDQQSSHSNNHSTIDSLARSTAHLLTHSLTHSLPPSLSESCTNLHVSNHECDTCRQLPPFTPMIEFPSWRHLAVHLCRSQFFGSVQKGGRESNVSYASVGCTSNIESAANLALQDTFRLFKE